MSVEFSNVYQEILLDNVVAIIKQNFVLQTQLRIAETAANEKHILAKRLDEVILEYNNLKNNTSQFNNFKDRAEQNSKTQKEVIRVQTALNEEMQKSKTLQQSIESLKLIIENKDTVIASLEEHITKLTSIAPVSKLKKIVVTPTQTKTELVNVPPKTLTSLMSDTKNGGTF